MSVSVGEGRASTAALCAECTELVGVTGTGIMLMGDGAPKGTAGATDEVSAQIEDLQLTLGEGPCLDAYHQDRPVLEPDLAGRDTRGWPAFAPAALDLGVRAIFGFPVHAGSVRLGALNLYRTSPGRLTANQHADAVVIAGMVGESLLAMQAVAPPGAVGFEFEAGADLRQVVHQASGMVSVQLDTSVAMALVCLRAAAFGSERPLVEIAEAVVGRTLRLD
jgi:hypothetical protein